MTSGEKLKQLRRQLGLTQRQVAEALRVTDQTVSNWEANRFEPRLSIRQMQILCRILQCSLEELPDFADLETPRE